MNKPKLLIIVLFQNLGDEQPYFAKAPSPPLTGLLLAGLTPPVVEIEVLHEMVRPIDYETMPTSWRLASWITAHRMPSR